MIDKKPPVVRTTTPPAAMAVLDIQVEGPHGTEVPKMGLHAGLTCPPECDCHDAP